MRNMHCEETFISVLNLRNENRGAGKVLKIIPDIFSYFSMKM